MKIKKEMAAQYANDLLEEAMFSFMVRPEDFYKNVEVFNVLETQENDDDDEFQRSEVLMKIK